MTNEVHERHKTSITTPSDTEIRIERTFDAPRQLVWEAYTDPELLPEWLGPRELTMTVDEFELRPGGSYRFTHRDSEGNEFVFFGELREVEEPNLIVRTFAWEGMPGKFSVERAEFEELEGDRTRIVVTSSFDLKEDRDGMLESGMEHGVVESYTRLDELFERQQSG
ncbi:MAG: ATPase [Actinobacteria bacterium]|nr:MAG: ATPase [Actinomycetota bacterium]